ncbi:MAG: bifunctional tetrahydrofolate synthase/dihydrofolate synthase [Burkholderiaceae bacterium]
MSDSILTGTSSLAQWLAHCEQLHPTAIDMGLARVQAVAARLNQGRGLTFTCPVMTVAGTNGKGSTCAMLESILRSAGYKTGVFTSPHLVRFEERCRIDGQEADAAHLCAHFALVEAARKEGGAEISLTYFEFTALAILSLMAALPLDAVVLEVGLGGRLDAVNIVDTDCAIITSIALDHMAFLGDSRELIGREKAGIMRPGKPVIVSDPVPPASLAVCADEIGAELWLLGRDFNVAGDQQQWAWAGRGRRYSGLAYPALRGANQLINAAGVLAALQAVRERLPVTAQAIRSGLAMTELPGRFQIVPGQPALVLDVAHNPHSVAALAENLDAMGFYPATHAVFGAMADKDVTSMFRRIAPLVDAWYFTDLPSPRAMPAAQLLALWQSLELRPDAATCTVASAQEGLQLALGAAGLTDRIVVFGSFYAVGSVLEAGISKLRSVHRTTVPALP